MSVMPRFADPWMLLFLLLIPWSIYAGMGIRSLGAVRKWTAIVLRCLIIACLAAALARTELVKHHDRLAVFFLLDHSDSVPEPARLSAAQWVRNVCERDMTEDDRAGVIVFGENASVELKADASLNMGPIRSQVGGEQTDLAGALRLAMAAFPEGHMRRMVVLSDGNETRGAALEETKIARADGIAVDALPLRADEGQEVRVREVTAPGQVDADEPFQLRIVANARQATGATLRVYQRGTENRILIQEEDVTLDRGDNVFLLPQELRRPGFYQYEAVLESDDDTISMNNTGRGFTRVHGEPRVLVLASDPEESAALVNGLMAEGIDVEQTHPAALSPSPARLQNYDAVLLANVSATELSPKQLSLLEAAVRDHGIGLVMVGGPDSFGAGGYLDTPVEKALPVDMDIKQRKVLPRGALVTILHTCEFVDGNAWARDITIAALEVLASQDLMGGLGYMHATGDSWIFDLQPVGDKVAVREAIRRGASAIGDMPSMAPTLQMAYDALADEGTDAAVKRVLIISDGDAAMPARGLLKKYADAGIAISAVCINPHSASDQGRLEALAQATGGQYYYVNNPARLPQIFMKEAAVVKRGVLVEEEFVPAFWHDSELLLGLGEGDLPPLLGYVVTTPKENATVALVSHEDDPVLAQWRYGLGKAVAFTSDVSDRWAAPWLGWEGYNRFWAQTVRWAMRDVTPSDFRVETSIQDGMGYVRIDAVDSEGNFVNFLRPEGVVTSPEFEKIDLRISQTGPGIYEGYFPLGGAGIYMANLTYTREDGTAGMIPTGLALDYSREYEYSTTNLTLLEDMALAGGGRLLGAEENPFLHDLEAPPAITPVWYYLAALAACLLPLEIFVRRVVIPLSAVLMPVMAFLRRIPGIKRLAPKPKERTAPLTGVYRAATEHDFGEAEEGATFGTVRAPTDPPLGPAPPPEAAPATPQGKSEYTSKLLQAKQRALEEKNNKGKGA